jgi:uncharacterized protein with HEPN domain
MSTKSFRTIDFLEHILLAIERIEKYTLDKDESAFLLDEQLQDAVIRNIEVLGEAANNIKKSDPIFTDRHPEVPWLVMVAMRNRVSHGYFSIDLEIIWNTIRSDLPSVKDKIQVLLTNLRA